MKKFKRIFALLLSVVMILGLAATAWAADDNETTEDATTTTTGSITIENSVLDATYTVYKIFDATYDEESEAVAYTATSDVYDAMKNFTYTNDDGDGVACPFTFTLNSQGTYNVSTNANIGTIAAWLAEFLASGENNVMTGTEYTGTGDSLTISGLDFGYYYITTTTGSVVTIDSVTPNVTVIDENQGTTDGTKTMKINGKSGLTSESVEYGTTIDFTVTLNATNYVGETKVKSYTIEDKLSDGLELDAESIVVYVGDVKLTAGKNYTLTIGSDKSGFTIVIEWVDSDGDSLYDSKATITITYSATVTEEGDYDGEEETNTATFYYNNTEINEEATDVTVYSFWLVKTDSSDNSVLSGAEFTLYYDENCESAVELVAVYDDEGDISYYRVATSDDEDIVTTIEAGYVEIKGLAEGTYYLVETTAPDGYIALTEAETVTVGSSGTTVTFKNDGTYESGGVNVANAAGSELPSTGGMGRTILYAIGIVLILGAGIVLVVKRRAKAN